MLPTSRIIGCGLILIGVLQTAHSADKPDAETKTQIAAAQEHLKTAKLLKMTMLETDSLLLFSPLASDKAKTIADAAQKTLELAYKTLKFEDKAKLWPGKLTVFLMPDRSKEYIPFLKLVEQRSGKIDAEDNSSLQLRGNEPYAVVSLTPNAKPTDATLRVAVCKAVAVALLDHKAGAPAVPFNLPTWLHTGFGTAMMLRSEPTSRDAIQHKQKVQALFSKSKLSTFTVTDIWGETNKANRDVLATSLVEYMLFGSDADKFEKVLNGFKPSEDRRDPDAGSAFEAAGWKWEQLDADWKKWVLKQK